MGEIFRRGDFITMMKYPGMFAIFGGDIMDDEENNSYVYTLIAYFCPKEHSDDNEEIFSCTIDQTDAKCEYIIDKDNLSGWRRCTSDEKTDALKFLADKKNLAYEEASCIVRRLKNGETLSFGAPSSNMRVTGGTAFNTYQEKNATTTHKKFSTVTRVVVENWEQKDPISIMSQDRRNELLDMCEAENKPSYSGAAWTGEYYPSGYNKYGYYGCGDYEYWD